MPSPPPFLCAEDLQLYWEMGAKAGLDGIILWGNEDPQFGIGNATEFMDFWNMTFAPLANAWPGP